MRPGRRLDEQAPGYGFGLPIARELAELYGGSLSLGHSELGGLSSILKLPKMG
jgi:signal transduction histidine kinase